MLLQLQIKAHVRAQIEGHAAGASPAGWQASTRPALAERRRRGRFKRTHLRAFLGCTRQAPAVTLNHGQLGEQRDQEHAKAAWRKRSNTCELFTGALLGCAVRELQGARQACAAVANSPNAL